MPPRPEPRQGTRRVIRCARKKRRGPGIAPTRTIAETIYENILANVVGRDRELAVLMDAVEAEAPLVRFVQGPSGIGKTTLIQALISSLTQKGTRALFVDGRDVEPTPQGVLSALARALGAGETSLKAAPAALNAAGPRVVLVIDAYEPLGLVDTWLRQAFIPALPDNVRIVIATQLPPGPQWTEAVQWRGHVDLFDLEPLSDEDAHDPRRFRRHARHRHRARGVGHRVRRHMYNADRGPVGGASGSGAAERPPLPALPPLALHHSAASAMSGSGTS